MPALDWSGAEAVLRIALAALGIFVALLSGFALRARPAARAFAALCALCTAAYAICTGGAFPSVILLFLCAALPAAFWAFANAWFDDEFPADARAWPVIAATGALGLAGGPFDIARRLIALALAAHALFVLWRGRRSDLVEERLGARRAALWIAGAYVIGVLAVELWTGGAQVPAWVQALNLGAIWLVTAAAAITLTRWDLREPAEPSFLRKRESMDLGPRLNRSGATTVRGNDEAAATRPIPADEKLLAALERTMREEHLYRQEGLTIAALAKHLGTQEHRLRHAINKGLGYRNFNEYLHRYRLEEVAERLKRAEDAHLPILTLALEAGYASIGPFNRAFKARYGVTPSAFRSG